MKLLAFETATEACSVAVWIDGDVRERFELAPRRHAELALPWAQQLLAEAGVARSQLDAIAVGRGPGAFTGVRLAVALAQGIALALDKPVVPVSTLATLAMQATGLPDQDPDPHRGAQSAVHARQDRRILAAIDARMGEVYSAAFQRDGDAIVALSAETVGAPDAVLLPQAGSDWHGVGTGFGAAGNALQVQLAGRFATIDAAALPHAADVARLAAVAFARGEGVAPERVEPAYLRDKVALTLAEQHASRGNR